jgi:hypothetical protein
MYACKYVCILVLAVCFIHLHELNALFGILGTFAVSVSLTCPFDSFVRVFVTGGEFVLEL